MCIARNMPPSAAAFTLPLSCCFWHPTGHAAAGTPPPSSCFWHPTGHAAAGTPPPSCCFWHASALTLLPAHLHPQAASGTLLPLRHRPAIQRQQRKHSWPGILTKTARQALAPVPGEVPVPPRGKGTSVGSKKHPARPAWMMHCLTKAACGSAWQFCPVCSVLQRLQYVQRGGMLQAKECTSAPLLQLASQVLLTSLVCSLLRPSD